MRAGYGVFFSPTIGSTAANTLGVAGALTTTTWVASIDGFVPTNYLNNPFPNGTLQSASDPVVVYQLGTSMIMNDRNNLNNASTQQWNLNLQREFPGDMLVEVAYAGNKGTRLPMVQEFNQMDPRFQALGTSLSDRLVNPFAGIIRDGSVSTPTVARSQLLRPYPQYTNITSYLQNRASSTYHSMTLRLEKRTSRGFSGQLSYTAGKLIDNAAGRVVNITDFVPSVQNFYDLRSERAVSEADTSQRLVLFGAYDLPFGRGTQFGSAVSGLVNHIIGGWSIAAWGTYHTGYPLRLSSIGSSGVPGAGTLRPNSNGKSAIKSGSTQSRLIEYFDTTAFRVPDPFTFGNVGRTLPDVRGPGQAQVDVALHKDFSLTERWKLRLRAEAYNVANTPFFDHPGLMLGSSNFGLIQSARLNRTIQVAAKIVW